MVVPAHADTGKSSMRHWAPCVRVTSTRYRERFGVERLPFGARL